jgi:hypothetical protein
MDIAPARRPRTRLRGRNAHADRSLVIAWVKSPAMPWKFCCRSAGDFAHPMVTARHCEERSDEAIQGPCVLPCIAWSPLRVSSP